MSWLCLLATAFFDCHCVVLGSKVNRSFLSNSAPAMDAVAQAALRESREAYGVSPPRTPPMKRGTTAPQTPGIRAVAQRTSTGIGRFLKKSNGSTDVLRQLLNSDPTAAILPVDDGRPVLIVAMHQKCSLDVFRILLAHGAQPDQVDNRGRNALSALQAMSLPFTDGRLPPMPSSGRLGNTGGLRPCAVLSRLHVSYAIELFKAGVQPVAEEEIGLGNEACAACIAEYSDALASVIIRRWMSGGGAMAWWSFVADYLHSR